MNGILLATPAHLATTMDAALRQNQTNQMTGAESYLRLEAAVRSRDRLAPEEEAQNDACLSLGLRSRDRLFMSNKWGQAFKSERPRSELDLRCESHLGIRRVRIRRPRVADRATG
jgi:hypothetical protein